MANYPPNAPPPGGYGGPPPGGGGYGGPPGGGGYGGPPGGPPPGGYGPPPGGYGPPPGGFGGPPPGMPGGPMMMGNAPFGIDPVTGMPYSDKSKMVAGLLNIFLFGVGRLYTGHIGIGIAQILTTLFCGVGYIWALIDGIMMLTGKVPDAQGRPLRD
jgi:TM2 domain-containing membrane protein YozV